MGPGAGEELGLLGVGRVGSRPAAFMARIGHEVEGEVRNMNEAQVAHAA